MSSWKLVGAAIKAQRTWSNLSPEQKEQVRQKAGVAARNAYARMQDPDRPQQQPAPAPPPAAESATPEAEEPQSSASASGTPAAEALIGMARAHGPRLARQAATHAVARSQGRASQLVRLWRRTQRPSK